MGKRAAIIILICAMLTGCSWLFPPPPPELIAAAEQYEDEVRALPGVKTAEVAVREADSKDRPKDWQVRLVVDALSADGLSTLPGLVDAVSAPPGAELIVTLRFPEGAGLAPVVVSNPHAADIERVAVLRTLPFVASVEFYFDLTVEIVEGTQLVDAVAGVRASQVLTSRPYDHLVVSDVENRLYVDVSLVGPSDALIGLIDEFERDAGVERISLAEPSINAERPTVAIETDDPTGAAAALAGLSEPTVEGRPRTSFSVSDDDHRIRGFVGLALGSAEPDDLPSEQAIPVDPGVLAADVLGVTEMLEATIESSGIAGAAEVFTSVCTDSETSAQAQGSVLLPVFDHEDSADRAYEAIVARWEADGYAQTDQATGTAIYTTSEPRPAAQLTIRGSAEGIWVWAFGACRG